jgi:hypothetical protein
MPREYKRALAEQAQQAMAQGELAVAGAARAV